MPIDFPSNPTNGQVYANYIYDSSITAWRNVNTDAGIGTLNAMGLKNVVPTSVVVGSGSASTNSNGKVTFSGATSISFNGVFGSTYKNYRVQINLDTNSANTEIRMRLRKNGTDYSSANYNIGAVYARTNGSAVAAWAAASAGHWPLFPFNGGGSGSGAGSGYIDVRPYDVIYQPATLLFQGGDGTSLLSVMGGASCFSGQSANDGFTIYPATGTMDGSVTVYGYTN